MLRRTVLAMAFKDLLLKKELSGHEVPVLNPFSLHTILGLMILNFKVFEVYDRGAFLENLSKCRNRRQILFPKTRNYRRN